MEIWLCYFFIWDSVWFEEFCRDAKWRRSVLGWLILYVNLIHTGLDLLWKYFFQMWLTFKLVYSSKALYSPKCVWASFNQLKVLRAMTGFLKNFSPKTTTSMLTWIFSLLICPTDFELTSSNNYMSQFLKINQLINLLLVVSSVKPWLILGSTKHFIFIFTSTKRTTKKWTAQLSEGPRRIYHKIIVLATMSI